MAIRAEAEFAAVELAHELTRVELNGELLCPFEFLNRRHGSAALGDVVDHAVANLHLASESAAAIESTFDFALKRFKQSSHWFCS